MKKLITYLTLIICITANAQSDKVNEMQADFTYTEVEWRKGVDNSLRQLKAMSVELQSLKKQVESLKQEVETLRQNIGFKEFLSVLNLQSFETIEDLPTDLNADEVGLALVKDKNKVLKLAISINNQWQFYKL